MILSFHPCIVGHENIICAGRDPNDTDLQAISAARAVVLSQGVRPALYWMARKHCPLVFPNYDARFSFPGKTGQIELFQKYNAPHPRSQVFQDSKSFDAFCRKRPAPHPIDFPLVLKLDWGGEGDTVFFVTSANELDRSLDRVRLAERSGNGRFLIQEYVPGGHRSLRVVVIGQSFRSYWRIQRDANQFLVNLAGFDLLYADNCSQPLLIEINYFFGRRGLGGSEVFYTLLDAEIRRWLEGNGLSQPEKTSPS